MKKHHRALLRPTPQCCVWLRDLSCTGDSHNPHRNAKHGVQFPLQELKDGFEGGDVQQGFVIAFAWVMLWGGNLFYGG